MKNVGRPPQTHPADKWGYTINWEGVIIWTIILAVILVNVGLGIGLHYAL